jgi:hypothetical protein
MKKLILILLILLIPFASAQCLEIKIAKTSYLAGETFQAEITGNLIKPLVYNDLSFFYNNLEYFPVANLQQIAANKWIIFVDVEKIGLNEFEVKSVICRDNETLKEETKKVSFTVQKPLSYYYTSLETRVKNNPSLTSDELSQSLIAIPSLSSQALLSKGTGECWPSPNCTTISTSLAILALNSSNNTEARNWLLDSQNSVSIGLWKLITESDSGKECALTINDESSNLSIPSGINEVSLNLPDDDLINISLDCNISAKISHTYLGKVHEFPLGILNNKKCWGKTYRSNCDALSTAYALRVIQDSEAETWLSENAKTTEEIAYAYAYSGDYEFENWLINNQHSQGFWSNSSLAISNSSDIKSTVAAIKALKENAKAENWLRVNLDSLNIENLALAMQLLSSKIEPVVSLKQGFVKTSSNQIVELKFNNKGIFPVQLSASLLGSQTSIAIPAKATSSLNLSIPQVNELSFESIDVSYLLGDIERQYSIPAVIYASKEAEMQSNLLNQTVSQSALKSASFNFIETEINQSLSPGEIKTVTVSLKNNAPSPVTVDFTIWGLSDVIQDIPTSVNLSSLETKTISIVFKSTGLEYSGQITAESAGQSTSIPVYIYAKQAVSDKSCSSLNGKICELGYSCSATVTTTPEGSCCIGECKKQSQAGKLPLKTIGIVMIILAIAIAVAFFFLKSKKPKRQSLEKVLAKIKEESRINMEEAKPEDTK